MISKKELLHYFTPSALQAFYSLIIALLISLYWSKEQLGDKLVSSGGKESVHTFQELIRGFIDYWTNNDVIAFLSIALVWAMAGIFILAFVYETINIFIALRNDRLMTTQFTHAEENKKTLEYVFIFRVILAIGLLIFSAIVFAALVPLWHSLINQPTDHFFDLQNILKEAVGVIGLGATICIMWRWVLILFSKLD